MEKAIFTIDGGIYVEGMHIPSNRWNGWAKPIFPLESAQVIATWLDDSRADFREGGIVVMIDGVPHWKELDESDGEVMTYPCVKCVVNGTDYYDIGAGGWVWDDVTFPDFGDDEESHDYWVGEIKACEHKSSGVMELVGK
jgi:hypothetical protein